MDYNKIEDAVMKNALDVFRQSAVEFFGLKVKIVAPARTEIKNLSISTGSTDYTFYTEDGNILHFEFQTTDSKEDLSRFMLYDAGIYSKEKVKIRTIVVYSSEIERVDTEIDAGTIKYSMEPFYMVSMDGDKKFEEIREKIEKKIAITKEEILSLTLIPLMKVAEDKTEITTECIKLVQRIEDGDVKYQSLCMLYALLDKFGYKEGKEKIKEVFLMTQIGAMIYEDGVRDGELKGIEKGIEKGMEKGIEKGMGKGLEKGLADLKSVIIDTLEVKYEDVPLGLLKQIQNINDADVLKLVNKKALKSAGISEVMEYVDKLLTGTDRY